MTTNSFDWDELQLNPDNWIVIPEFGVMPADVDFEGFAYPILDPTTDADHWRVSLFDASKMVRRQARTRFSRLADVKDSYYKALVEIEHDEDKPTWTGEHLFAIRYSMFFEQIKQSIDCFEEDKESCLNSVSFAMQMALKMLENKAVDLAEVRSELSRIGGFALHQKNPLQAAKQKAKASVKECWDDWQKHPTRYSGDAAFAKDMLLKFEELESQPVITRWCRTWRKNPAS